MKPLHLSLSFLPFFFFPTQCNVGSVPPRLLLLLPGATRCVSEVRGASAPASPPAHLRNGPAGSKSSSEAPRWQRRLCRNAECLSWMAAVLRMELCTRFGVAAGDVSLPASTCPSLSPLCNLPRAITAVLTWRSDIGKVFSHF